MADTQIRVGSATPVAQLASAIANRIYEGNTVVLQMIGAAAISQAVKAIAVASGFTGQASITISARPAIEDIPGNDGTVTRVLIRVFPDKPLS
jgi:stage V sporulation protein S